MTEGLREHEDGHARCVWAAPGDALYCDYHDREWGRPVADERRLFEKLCLEGFQSGLSWRTILAKRERFREVFFEFDVDKVAKMDDSDVERLLQDAGIIRHRGKIEATIHNARTLLEVWERGDSLGKLIWSVEPGPEDRPRTITWEALTAIPTTAASKTLSKMLRKRGFKFVGPTTAYAAMQAMGVVNDHVEGCAFRAACEAERSKFTRPA